MVFFSILVLWIVALCLHEYAHARTAFAGGDTSVAAKGYLSLNPLRYIHPVMSIVIPLIILAIGGVPLPGGAVYIDMTRIRSRGWQSAVSAAGPAANLALFFLCSLPFAFGLAADNPDSGTLWPTLAFFAFLQVYSAVLNLLPVPGLDGFGILEPWLPWTWRRTARLYGNVFMIGLILLMVNRNPISDGIFRAAFEISTSLGIPVETLLDGWKAFERGKPF